MEKENKTNIIISAALILANALGIAYFLNPEKFRKNVNDAKDAIRKTFGK